MKSVGRRYLLSLPVLLCAGLIAPAVSLAEQPPVPITTDGGVGSESTLLQTKAQKDTGISSPIEMFRGWSQLYKGYDRSPIVFDSMVDGRKRRYPHASYLQVPAGSNFSAEDQQQMRDMSIKVFNLGVDDEVDKTSMTMYQPLHFLALDYAMDPQERDRHLDLFKSLRGIAVLTLSYLDKTVAAGLATTQQQIDAHTSNQLLKQINWTEKKISDPARAPLYQDIDEKVETCLKFGSDQAMIKTGRVPFPGPGFVCDGACRDQKYGVPGAVGGAGAYDYCVCCAEHFAGLNSTVRAGTFDSPADKNPGPRIGWSLVERIFLGTDGPTGVIPGPQLSLFKDNMANFREMYGDVLLAPCKKYNYQEQGGGAQTDSPSCIDGNFSAGTADKIEFRLPELAVSDKIKLFRDGLADPSTCGSRTGTACPLAGTTIREGICPAVKQILTLWPPQGAVTQQMRDLWVQASLGRLLTGDDINNMFIMMGLEPGSLNGQWNGGAHDITNFDNRTDISSRFKRFINVFCDAAAMSAFKKYHYRMMSITEDQLRINQKATETEKAKMRDLMGRITSSIELAERDIDASSTADRMLAGLDSEADRERVAQMGAAAEAQQAAMWNERMKNNITLWNWFRGSGNN